MPKPITTGAATAITPGKTILASAALVAISTQRAVSGSALPSSSPGISWNCRRISWIISNAASPTAVIVIDAIRNGSRPPTNVPINTVITARFNEPLARLYRVTFPFLAIQFAVVLLVIETVMLRR